MHVLDTHFRERWDDPNSPDEDHPIAWIHDKLHHTRLHADPLPPQLPAPPEAGPHFVQTLRTYPAIRPPYNFAPEGRAVGGARLHEGDQAGPSADLPRGPVHVVGRRGPAVRRGPDRPPASCTWSSWCRASPTRKAPSRSGRNCRPLAGARDVSQAPVRDGCTSSTSRTTPATRSTCTRRCASSTTRGPASGSDNFNRRSWTHDSELSSAVLDTTRDPREPLDPGGERRGRPDLRPGPAPGCWPASTSISRTTAREDDDILDPARFVASLNAGADGAGRLARGRTAGPPAPRTAAAAPRRSGCRSSRGCGRRRSTGCSTIPTDGRCGCGSPRSSEPAPARPPGVSSAATWPGACIDGADGVGSLRGRS